MVRDWPESSILDIRDEALLWQVEEVLHQSCQEVQSDVSEALCSVVTMEREEHTILDQVHRAVGRQDKQITELTKTLAEFSRALKDLTTGSICRTVPELRQRVRPQPRFTPDGKPIDQLSPYVTQLSSRLNCACRLQKMNLSAVYYTWSVDQVIIYLWSLDCRQSTNYTMTMGGVNFFYRACIDPPDLLF